MKSKNLHKLIDELAELAARQETDLVAQKRQEIKEYLSDLESTFKDWSHSLYVYDDHRTDSSCCTSSEWYAENYSSNLKDFDDRNALINRSFNEQTLNEEDSL